MSVRELHQQAMEFFGQALFAHQRSQEKESLALFAKGLDLEKQAAYESLEKDVSELTRSVLFRGAAWFAIKAHEYDEAERIALTALARGAHPEEKEKLREVLFCAMKKLGVHDPTEDDTAAEEAVDEKELAAV